jgi:hypothetical protein
VNVVEWFPLKAVTFVFVDDVLILNYSPMFCVFQSDFCRFPQISK